MNLRQARVARKTAETDITAWLRVEGSGQSDISTGIGFLDHLFDALVRHARFDLDLHCEGDLHVDDHHTAEDCGIVLGTALRDALGDRVGIRRFGHAYAPLDGALARAVVDICGRPYARVDLGLERERLGELSCENVAHVLTSMAAAAAVTLHVDVLQGQNDHHRAEAAFKACALALRVAVAASGFDDVASTKGTLGGDAP